MSIIETDESPDEKSAKKRVVDVQKLALKLRCTVGTVEAMITALRAGIVAAGGPVKMGKSFGITTAAISAWDICPALRVTAVERLTGVSRHHLRPDIFSVPVTTRAMIRNKKKAKRIWTEVAKR